MHFGDFLKAARKNRNMTQKECAEQLDITARTYRDYEKGKHNDHLLVKLMMMFDISASDLKDENTDEIQ